MIRPLALTAPLLLALAQAQPLTPRDTGMIEFNTARLEQMREGLVAPTETAGVFLCTFYGVMLHPWQLQMWFGIALLVAVAMAVYGYYAQTRGAGVSTIFWLIVLFMALVAVVGFVFTQIMECGPVPQAR